MAMAKKIEFAKKLEGKKIILKYPSLKYTVILMKSYNHPNIGPNLKHDWKNRTLKEQKEWIIRKNKKRKKGEQLLYLILDKKTKNLIGSCNLQKIDFKNKVAEVGIWILPQFQNKGYAYDAMDSLLGYAFETLKLDKINYLSYSYNKESQKFAKNLKFKRVKIDKKRYLRKNKPIDLITYNLSKSTWKKMKNIKKFALREGRPVREKEFPTFSYKFSKKTAQQAKKIVLSGKIHHKQGEYVKKFEMEFAEYIGVRYALTTNSGTSALQLALHALNIGPGDEVLIPAYTFISVAQAVLAQGAVPIFVDIDETFNISPESIKKKISSKTRAIIVVHMFGNIAKINEILSIAKTHRLKIIEDAAQAIGAKYKGKKVGSIGDIGYFSFNIKKAVPSGQGGMVVTSNTKYMQQIYQARNRGMNKKGVVVSIGYTMFMTELEAMLGLSALKDLDKLNLVRKCNAKYLLNSVKRISDVLKPPLQIKYAEPSFYRLVFKLNEKKLGMSRDKFIELINKEGIPFKTFYPFPLYNYPFFKKNKKIDKNRPTLKSELTKQQNVKCPNAEKFCKEQVGIEFSPYITKKDVEDIIGAIFKVLGPYLRMEQL